MFLHATLLKTLTIHTCVHTVFTLLHWKTQSRTWMIKLVVNLVGVVNIETFFYFTRRVKSLVRGFSKRFHFFGQEQSGVHFTAQWLFGVKRCLRVLQDS